MKVTLNTCTCHYQGRMKEHDIVMIYKTNTYIDHVGGGDAV